MDSALRRPGRFDRELHFSLPGPAGSDTLCTGVCFFMITVRPSVVHDLAIAGIHVHYDVGSTSMLCGR